MMMRQQSSVSALSVRYLLRTNPVIESIWRLHLRDAVPTYAQLCWSVLAIFALFGVVFTFLMPPFQVPDEEAHWRAAISRTDFGSSQATGHCSAMAALPRHFTFDEVAVNSLQSQFTGKFRALSDLRPSCVGDSVAYGGYWTYPGVALVRALTAARLDDGINGLRRFYLARLTQGLIFLSLVARFLLANRRLGWPPGALSGIALLASPLLVQQSFGISADMVINSSALALATLVISAPNPKRLDLALTLALGSAAAFTKPIIVPIVLATLALLAISSGRFARGGATQKRSTASLCMIAILVVLCLASGILQHNVLSSNVLGPSVNAAKQISWLTNNPAKGIQALATRLTDLRQLELLLNPLGWLTTPLPMRLIIRCEALIAMAILIDVARAITLGRRRTDDDHTSPHFAPVLLILLGFFGYFFLLVASMYVAWTPVGAPTVDGIQSRYYFPAFLWALSLLPGALAGSGWTATGRLNSPPDYRTQSRAIGPFMALTGAFALYHTTDFALALLSRYW